jgi:hypothetical protein
MIQDEIIEMAEQAGMTQDGDMWFSFGKGDMDVEHKHLVAFAKLVAAKEREACAEICDSFYLSWIDIQGRYEFMGEGASECAGAIRARGEA